MRTLGRRAPAPSTDPRDLGVRLINQVASVCLSYPDDEVRSRFPTMLDLLGRGPRTGPVEQLSVFLTEAGAIRAADLQMEYVLTFDFDRKHALHLSYWTDGDTRRRGTTLATIKRRYRDSGAMVDTRGELPDHLSMVLEFGALVEPVAGREILLEHRAGLELLRLALIEAGSRYAGVVQAVCGTLPGPAPQDRAAARALAARGPATETVGLDPVPAGRPDRPLLPLTPVGDRDGAGVAAHMEVKR